jgi:formamidopyrimidine-DNA glycosylase
VPELPEAETIARGLDRRLAGSFVRRVRVHRHEVVQPMRPGTFVRRLSGRRIERVGRRGKWITAQLDDGSRWVTQLRMTGRFTWEPPGRLRTAPHLSASLLVEGTDASGIVRFFDVRRFARMWIVDPAEWLEIDLRLGIEPLSDDFTPDALGDLLARSRAPIRNALLDQHRIAGIGNIYASEACFLAALDPRRAARTLAADEIERLHGAIRQVLERAIAQQGTSFSDYKDVNGAVGNYQNELAVYGRAGEACVRCDGKIARVVMAGRSAFYCPVCSVRRRSVHR